MMNKYINLRIGNGFSTVLQVARAKKKDFFIIIRIIKNITINGSILSFPNWEI